MRTSFKTFAFIALAAIAAPAILLKTSHASDHADTKEIAMNPGFDISDVHIFPSATDKTKVVLSMSVNPLIAPGDGTTTTFDPNVLYQFKIDSTGDGIEDAVIQARFSGGDSTTQRVSISRPTPPSRKGTLSVQEPMLATTGAINTVFDAGQGIKVFAGGREDAFFFDLDQFFKIFPDRATPLTGVPDPTPNMPKANGFRPAGQAVDFLSAGRFNVLAIVVELPRALLLNRGGGPTSKTGLIGVWCTTSVPLGSVWTQKDRLSRPVINEVFATVANDQHKQNDEISPTQDATFLRPDIIDFVKGTAGRSDAIAQVIANVIVPDVMKVNLTSKDPATYLGVETGGATGGTFGGRALSNDVIDLSLGIVFGGTIPALGLAPEDNKELPAFTTDNVGAGGKHFLPTFPYLGVPRT